MFSKLTEELNAYLGMGIPGYDCIVYHKGKQVYRHFAGYADKENQILMNGNERYNIYSCTKVVTVVAALMLVEKGVIGLDDLLCKYMPEFTHMQVHENGTLRKAEKQITVRHLFTMSAGFSYDIYSEKLKLCVQETNGRCPTRETMKYLAQEPLLFEPGTRYEYSLCHDVLAALVEVVSKKTFGEFVKENIFIPCDMKTATFLATDKEVEEICAHYTFDQQKQETVRLESKRPCYQLGSAYESGGAGMSCKVEDYIKFLENLRLCKLIKQETIDLMQQDELKDIPYENNSFRQLYEHRGYVYGLGVRCPSKAGKETDFGWGGAAGAYLAVDQKNEITFFYAQHVLNQPNCERRKYLPQIIRDCILNH